VYRELQEVISMTVIEPKVDKPESGRRWKWLGAVVLAIPLAIFTVFAVAEGSGGEEGWWGHLIQLAIGLAILAGAWFYPRIAGPLLITGGVVLTAVVLVSGERDTWPTILMVLAPLVLAGVFFTLAGLAGRRRG
jgi:peptidoglycan/LPS O-acetylase OafA/YrhL